MIPQCCFISFKSMNFRNVLRKQCSATKTYPLQQTRCSSGHEMLMVLVLYVVLYSGEALFCITKHCRTYHQIGIIYQITFSLKYLRLEYTVCSIVVCLMNIFMESMPSVVSMIFLHGRSFIFELFIKIGIISTITFS